MRHCLAALCVTLLSACASYTGVPPEVRQVLDSVPVDVLLVGEQHDAPDHQESHRRIIQLFASRDRLAAVALEMAEQGSGTSGLPPDAAEEAVQTALRWQSAAWPWQAYRGAVMAAVRAGVPVVGANLPRSQMRVVMGDSSLDGLLARPSLEAQRQAIREGHCGLLPDSQIGPMTRIQIARDRTMAQVVGAAVKRGKTVVLLAGGGHVDESLGIPQHLPASVHAKSVRLPARPSQRDYCAEMRKQMASPPPVTSR